MIKNVKKQKSIRDLLIEYFKAHSKQDIAHGPVVDWVETRYKRLYNRKPRDTWRSIRNLHETGFLIKVRKGIYRYDPEFVKQMELESFTLEQKEIILKRDDYKCVQCGRGTKDGIELHVDHIKSRYEGGNATIENGETLCAPHNFVKKHLNQTETGKKMFIRLYELAKSEKNEDIIKFCIDILETYKKHNINGHIVWEK